MALLTISDLEVASGTDIPTLEEPRYQFYINAVTSYIETYLDQTFTAVSNEDLICQADSRGCITFSSLTSVSAVQERDNWLGTYTAYTSGNYGFDGVGTIYGLVPYTTYKVTVSYGWSTVPADIKAVATQLVMAGSGLEPSAAGGLSRYRVGDVEETYGVTDSGSGSPVVTLTSLQSAVLNSYSARTRTIRL